MATARRLSSPPSIFIVSGGVGASAGQVVNTVLAQFPDAKVAVTVISGVRDPAQIRDAVAQARAAGGTVVHTLVDPQLRRHLVDMAARRGVVALDLMGPLLERLADLTGQVPLGRPGFYRQLHRSYFERVEAIEYAMAHDDGLKRQDWPKADVVLIGVSRTGKTPLSIYLSVLGWKAANMPIVPEVPVPGDLYQLDPRRVIGLTIALSRLLTFRRERARMMGLTGSSSYSDPDKIAAELGLAQRTFDRGGFHVIDVTDKPVEASADEVIRHVGQTR